MVHEVPLRGLWDTIGLLNIQHIWFVWCYFSQIQLSSNKSVKAKRSYIYYSTCENRWSYLAPQNLKQLYVGLVVVLVCKIRLPKCTWILHHIGASHIMINMGIHIPIRHKIIVTLDASVDPISIGILPLHHEVPRI